MREELEKAEERGRERVFHEIARRLCTRQTVVEIARELNRPVSTMYRWMRSDAFSRILKDMDDQVWQNVMDELGDNSALSVYANATEDVKEAYDALRDIMTDKGTSSAVRRGAANDILEMHGFKEPPTQPGGRVQVLTQVQIHNLQETMEQVVEFNDEPSAGNGKPGVRLKN